MTDQTVSYYTNDGGASADNASFQRFIARTLGYIVGFGSLMLYTPIAVRVCLQKHADGLVLSTWWLKVGSYLLSLMYSFRKRYDLSTYAETLVITVEASVVLGLVAFYQRKHREPSFWLCLFSLVLYNVYAVLWAPESVVATGLLVSAAGNALALVPQFWHNLTHRSKGDYSPLTAGLAAGGCAIRIFTTITLNGADPFLMITFLAALLINAALLGQIVYYGTVVEGLALWQVLAADVVVSNRNGNDATTNAILSDGNGLGNSNRNSNRNSNSGADDEDHVTGYSSLDGNGGDGETDDPLSVLQRRENNSGPGTSDSDEQNALRRRSPSPSSTGIV